MGEPVNVFLPHLTTFIVLSLEAVVFYLLYAYRRELSAAWRWLRLDGQTALGIALDVVGIWLTAWWERVKAAFSTRHEPGRFD